MTIARAATPPFAPSTRGDDTGRSLFPGMMPVPLNLAALVVLALGAPTLHAQVPDIPTRTIDVDGISTRYHAAGLDTRQPGEPVVVFQSGGGGTPIESWAAVLAGLEGRAAVLAYDRPGIGGTSAPDGPPDVELVNQHLHGLLEKLEVAPPYLLVGHSWGGPLILDFASRYTDEVVGSIYVDPLTFLQTEEDRRAVIRTIATSDGEADTILEEMESFDEQTRAAMTAQLPLGVAAELDVIHRYVEAERGAAIPPPGHPVTVLLALQPMPPPPFPESLDPIEWFKAERRYTRGQFDSWLDEHANSAVQSLPESTHLVPTDAPQAIVDAIDTMLRAVQDSP